jgi:hypothetical protein
VEVSYRELRLFQRHLRAKEKRSERGLFGKYGYKENTKDIIGYDINKV